MDGKSEDIGVCHAKTHTKLGKKKPRWIPFPCQSLLPCWSLFGSPLTIQWGPLERGLSHPPQLPWDPTEQCEACVDLDHMWSPPRNIVQKSSSRKWHSMFDLSQWNYSECLENTKSPPVSFSSTWNTRYNIVNDFDLWGTKKRLSLGHPVPYISYRRRCGHVWRVCRDHLPCRAFAGSSVYLLFAQRRISQGTSSLDGTTWLSGENSHAEFWVTFTVISIVQPTQLSRTNTNSSINC